mmetsp:Transcript_85262/g.183891  ORF Transcript_85262/g.183891 Transcript_85262/m.183891 type:complete len:292 (+) Transcript_85262:828-1703(+)
MHRRALVGVPGPDIRPILDEEARDARVALGHRQVQRRILHGIAHVQGRPGVDEVLHQIALHVLLNGPVECRDGGVPGPLHARGWRRWSQDPLLRDVCPRLGLQQFSHDFLVAVVETEHQRGFAPPIHLVRVGRCRQEHLDDGEVAGQGRNVQGRVARVCHLLVEVGPRVDEVPAEARGAPVRRDVERRAALPVPGRVGVAARQQDPLGHHHVRGLDGVDQRLPVCQPLRHRGLGGLVVHVLPALAPPLDLAGVAVRRRLRGLRIQGGPARRSGRSRTVGQRGPIPYTRRAW